MADNNIYMAQNRIYELRAQITYVLLAEHVRGENEKLIALNPEQHQAFADAINGVEQQLADNNIYRLYDRIDELGAQIEAALEAAAPRVDMVNFLFEPNF